MYSDTILIYSLILQTLIEGPYMAAAGWESSTHTEDSQPRLQAATHLADDQKLSDTLDEKKPCISSFWQWSGSMALYSLENTSKDHVSSNLQPDPFY